MSEDAYFASLLLGAKMLWWLTRPSHSFISAGTIAPRLHSAIAKWGWKLGRRDSCKTGAMIQEVLSIIVTMMIVLQRSYQYLEFWNSLWELDLDYKIANVMAFSHYSLANTFKQSQASKARQLEARSLQCETNRFALSKAYILRIMIWTAVRFELRIVGI